MAGVAPMVPASPTPFAPSGFTGDGVSVLSSSRWGIITAFGSAIHQRSGDELAGLIVNNFFEQGLPHGLSYTPMNLTGYEHGIDLLAAVIDRDIALERDLACFRIDIHDSDVRAEWKRKILRFIESRGRESGFHVFRKAFGQVRCQGDFLYRHRFSARMWLRQRRTRRLPDGDRGRRHFTAFSARRAKLSVGKRC